MVVHICNPSIREAEAGGLRAQPGLHSETLPQQKENKKRKKGGNLCQIIENFLIIKK
jgi:hypothetical protein